VISLTVSDLESIALPAAGSVGTIVAPAYNGRRACLVHGAAGERPELIEAQRADP
jgi:hypothetical protein